MEEVAHTVDENAFRVTPSKRMIEHARLQRDFETVPVIPLTHSLQSMGEPLRIAELAAWTDFRAAGNRIPSRICPLDVGVFSHNLESLLSSMFFKDLLDDLLPGLIGRSEEQVIDGALKAIREL